MFKNANNLNAKALKFGAMACFTLGFGYLVQAFFLLARPDGQAGGPFGVNAANFFQSFLVSPYASVGAWIMGLIYSIAGLASTLILYNFVKKDENVHFAQFATAVGFLAWGLNVLIWVNMLGASFNISDAYANAGPDAKLVFSAYGANLDPLLICFLGLVGLWIILINITAYQSGHFSKALAIIGILNPTGYFTCVTGAALGLPILIRLGGAWGGVVMGPLYHIWLGFALWKLSKQIRPT